MGREEGCGWEKKEGRVIRGRRGKGLVSLSYGTGFRITVFYPLLVLIAWSIKGVGRYIYLSFKLHISFHAS